MKWKVICYWIVVLCGLTHNACAGTGARYGAGSSTRATPDYSNSGRMTCENQEGTFETLVKNVAAAKEAVYNSAWSGTRKDLEAIVKKAEQNYGFEDSKNLGRNATMLVPATLEEMRKEIVFGNPYGWDKEMLDYEHQPKGNGNSNVKYTTLSGDKNRQRNEQMGYEVVYDRITGRIVPNKYMGTKNFEPLYSALCLTCYPQNVNHIPKDMMPHKTKANPQNQFEKDGDQYKYVGILYERDSNDPEKYYIIDGQTGLPMTPQRVAEMPTTLSDMWKNMGLACVANDAEDVIKPDTCRNETKCSTETTQPDLHSLNLDDPNGDWCKCESPGCRANMDAKNGYVLFGCSKCKKVNVKYAKMALELEQKMKAAGVKGEWFGPNAKASAHKAATAK